MNSSTLELIVAAAVIVVAIFIVATVVNRRRRTQYLKSKFGSEYVRTVDDAGSERKAESALRRREARVSKFDIRALTPSARDGFVSNWLAIQAEFVEAPEAALTKAERLLDEVMRARGYPVEDFEQRSADLSVDHASVVENYRAGRDIAVRQSRGRVSTEELRQAMLHYRTLFEELAGEVDKADQRRAS